jgi:hypothetical protein
MCYQEGPEKSGETGIEELNGAVLLVVHVDDFNVVAKNTNTIKKNIKLC